MRIDDVEISRDANRCEISVTASGDVNMLRTTLVVLFTTMFPVMGLFVLLCDPRLHGLSQVFVLAWLLLATLLFTSVLLVALWQKTGRERWLFESDSLRFERWLGIARVKRLCVPLREVVSVTVEERRFNSRTGYRIYRKLSLEFGRRGLRGRGNLHAHDATKVSAALALAAQDFGYRPDG